MNVCVYQCVDAFVNETDRKGKLCYYLTWTCVLLFFFQPSAGLCETPAEFAGRLFFPFTSQLDEETSLTDEFNTERQGGP